MESMNHCNMVVKHKISSHMKKSIGEILPRACVVPDGIEPAIVKADCARIRVNRDLLLPTVLNACLNSPSTRERVVGLVKGIGRPRINLRHIRAIPVPLCSQAEQQAIESALVEANESIDNQLAAIELTLKRSSAQRKNILKSRLLRPTGAAGPGRRTCQRAAGAHSSERATRATTASEAGRAEHLEKI